MSVESPRAMAGQPSVCGRVGPVKTAENQSRTAGWKRSRAFARGTAGTDAVSGAMGCVASADFGGAFFEFRFGTVWVYERLPSLDARADESIRFQKFRKILFV